MTNIKRLLAWLCCSALCVATAGAQVTLTGAGLGTPFAGNVYYVDSSLSDTNASSGTPDCTTYNPVTFACGTGTANAFAKVADINAASFSPGDSVLLRRGQAWRETLSVPSSGSAAHSITFGAYGSGGSPVLNGADVVTGWSSSIPLPADTFGASPTTTMNFGKVGATSWDAGAFTPTSSYTLTQVGVKLKANVGNPFTSAVTCYIYSDNAGVPGSALATATSTIQPSLASSYGSYYFPFAGLALTSGTKYWVVLKVATGDNSNYASWGAAATSGTLMYYSSNGTTWTANPNLQGSIQTFYTGSQTNVWSAPVTPPSQNNGGNETERVVLFNGQYGYRQSSLAGLTSANNWYWANNTLYVYSTSSPATAYTSPGIEAAKRDYGIALNGKSYINITGLNVTTANSDDIWLGASGYVSVANDTLSNAGQHGVHAYGSASVVGVSITGTSTDHNGADGMLIQNAPSTYTSGLVVSQNTSYRDGIISQAFNEPGDIFSVYSYPAGFHTVSLYGATYMGNVVSYTGYRDDGIVPNQAAGNQITGVGLWLDANRGTSLANGSVAQYNRIFHTAQHGLFAEKGAYNTLEYNTVYTACQGVGVSSSCGGIEMNMDTANQFFIVGNQILNNTIYNSGNGIEIYGDPVGQAGDVVNNVVENNISVSSNHAFEVYYGGENDGTNGYGNVYAHNDFAPGATNFIKWGSTTYTDIASWQTASGQTANISADPSFTNAAGNDFSLQAGSPVIDTGLNLGAVYNLGLSPSTTWPNGVVTLDQNAHGAGWEYGAYIYP